jgi:predicted dehydrogenase
MKEQTAACRLEQAKRADFLTELVRIGVVGTSWWADFMHLPSLASHPQAQIGAICGRNAVSADALAVKYKIPKVYSDFRALVEDQNLDAVVIVTPDDTHYQIAMPALKRGMHVLCEKPLAISLDQAEELAATASESCVTHMMLFTWRWVPLFTELKSRIDQGDIGRPVAARMSYLAGGAFRSNYCWRNDATRCNGTLGDFGSHLIDLVHWTLGDVASVSASISTQIDRQGEELKPANDTVSLDLVCLTGVSVSLYASNAALLGDERSRVQAQILGTNGSIEANLVLDAAGANSWLTLTRKDDLQRETIEFENLNLKQVCSTTSAGPRAFVDAIVAGRAIRPNMDDGVAVQRVIDAAQNSNAVGCRIRLGPKKIATRPMGMDQRANDLSA